MKTENAGRRAVAMALLVSVLVVGMLPAAAQQPAGAKSKLVMQVSDGDTAKWNLALNNAKNVQVDLGATNVDIEIVAYGPGIGMLKADSPSSNRVADAVKSGVEMVACENTMTVQKLAKADMIASISYVPAGVVQLMKRQSQGWAYIRP